MATIPLPALDVRPPQQQETPMQQYGQALSLQSMVQQQKQQQAQLQGIQQENQLRQLQINDQNILRSSAKDIDWTKDDAFDKWMTNAQQNGVSPQTLSGLAVQRQDLLQKIAATGSAQLKLQQDKNNQLLGHIDTLRGITDPQKRSEAAQTQASQILSSGLASDPRTQAMVQSMAAGKYVPSDDDLDAYEGGLQDFNTQISNQLKKAEAAKDTAQAGEAQAGQFKSIPGTGAFFNPLTNEMKTPAGEVLSPDMMKSRYQELLKKQQLGQPLSADEKADLSSIKGVMTIVPQFNFNMQNSTGGNTPAAQVAQQFGMTPVAFDQAAEKYYQSGQLPPIGRGGSGQALNKALMNRAGELHPDAVLAANSAEYKANQNSLDNIQKSFDQVNAFENTALKNLDQVAQAGANVPELSARFANIPVRMIGANVLGTPEMAKFRTALLTAQTEAAKVLSSSNATGVLSDSARHEAEDVLDGNLPFPSMMASINQLKTDFANRHDSYSDQIADIKQRLGAKPAENNSATNSSAQQSGAKITPPSGKSLVYDPNGTPHFVNTATLKQFLADPKYKGWHE